MPADRSADAASARELSADVYRVFAVTVVVIAHWLVSAVTFHDGQFGNDYPLDAMPWTRWLTLVFQVVPVFFLVGGYASAASWTRWREAGGRRWTEWVRNRLAAILGPTTAYVMVVLVAVAVLDWVGVGRSPLRFGGWAVAMHLWFVPAYLALLTLTPVALAAHRRCGLLAPAVLGVAVVVVDVATRVWHLPIISSANYLLCWAAIYQVGICGAVGFGWPSARADRRRCRHRARDSARPALLPDQHGRIARRDRPEQFSAHRGVAGIRRGTSCGGGRRGARGDTSGAAIAVAAEAGPGEQQRDGGVPVANGSGRGRRTCRVPHRAVTAARGRDGTVVGLSIGLAADSACRDDRTNGTFVVGPIDVQSCAARDLHAPANVERTGTADRRRRDGDVRAGAPCGRGFRPRRALSGCVRVALRRRSRVDQPETVFSPR